MRKICIDPGHGGKDPGAVGKHNGVSYLEKDYALDISLKLGELLEKKGISACYTRGTDVFISLTGRSDYANSRNVELFISVHINSAISKKATGIETLVYKKTGESYELALLVQKHLIANTAAVDRGVKPQNVSVLRKTEMPAILVEAGFISNADECSKLAKESYRKIIAESIYRGVCDYWGLNYEIEESTAFKPYTVRVTADKLNIRKGPSTKYGIVGKIEDKGIYTIVEESNGWGKLKSKVGWISLRYTKKYQ